MAGRQQKVSIEDLPGTGCFPGDKDDLVQDEEGHEGCYGRREVWHQAGVRGWRGVRLAEEVASAEEYQCEKCRWEETTESRAVGENLIGVEFCLLAKLVYVATALGASFVFKPKTRKLVWESEVE
jgi:hypothetical protein